MRRFLTLELGALAAAATAFPACAPAEPPVAPLPQQSASPTPAATAEAAGEVAEDWEGIYQGPYHAFLAIRRKGELASGSWRSAGGRTGEFTGKVDKHRLELAWREFDQAGGSWSGRGYFLYRGAIGDRPPEIYGEWGLGEDRRGNAWWAVKRKLALPAETSEDGKTRSEGSDDRLCPGCDEIEYER